MREDEKLDVVGEGDSPEHEERKEESRAEEGLGQGVEPEDHGGRVESVGQKTSKRSNEGDGRTILGGQRGVDVASRRDDVEQEADGREDEEALVQGKVLDGQRCDERD